MVKPLSTPFGSWRSPITAELIARKSLGLGLVAVDDQDIYWYEMRPDEGGRYVLVRRTPDGQVTDITPQPYSGRTRVHEYGGGSFLVSDGVIYFSNYSDQRLYRQKPGSEPEPITPSHQMRYANGVVDHHRERMIYVREDHTDPDREAVNSLVALNPVPGGSQQILVSGNDFYASPVVDPGGTRLAWLTWNHPNMPWDATELWVADFNIGGELSDSRKVAGGVGESIFQPAWSPDGDLYFVSDRSNWWNIYRWKDPQIEPVCPMEAEFGLPQWVFGMSTYGFANADRLVCAYSQRGIWSLASIDIPSGEFQKLKTPYTLIGDVSVASGWVVFLAGSPEEPQSIVQMNLDTGETNVVRRSEEIRVDPKYLSIPEAIEFTTDNGKTAHAFFYPPKNDDFSAPAYMLPPLLVRSHGGPTSATHNTRNLGVQYWTSRGFAYLDVNYGGSTGYGRAYRERLKGQWGVVDVNDCENGARYLIDQGWVDGDRIAIRGGSAGGYTTLCALTFRDFFKAGASYYGVSDLEALAIETHKFESRYLDHLIGPYPAEKDLYDRRSPIHYTDQLSCPVIILQGEEDVVVPLSQAELMVNALKNKGIPVAYLLFEGEQHGFRRAENIQRAYEAEYYFYSRIFCFELAEQIKPILIENL